MGSNPAGRQKDFSSNYNTMGGALIYKWIAAYTEGPTWFVMCDDGWNIDHWRWSERCLLTRGNHIKKIWRRWNSGLTRLYHLLLTWQTDRKCHQCVLKLIQVKFAFKWLANFLLYFEKSYFWHYKVSHREDTQKMKLILTSNDIIAGNGTVIWIYLFKKIGDRKTSIMFL